MQMNERMLPPRLFAAAGLLVCLALPLPFALPGHRPRMTLLMTASAPPGCLSVSHSLPAASPPLALAPFLTLFLRFVPRPPSAALGPLSFLCRFVFFNFTPFLLSKGLPPNAPFLHTHDYTLPYFFLF